MNPRTVSDDFHVEIGEEELREEVDDEEALETGTKGDQEPIVLKFIMYIYFYSLSFEQYKYPLLILDFSLLVTLHFFEYLSAICTLENIAILRHSNFNPPSSNTSIL